MRLLVLFLVVATATPVATAGPLEPPELDRYLRWGPLRVRPGFRLANFGYDDNIFSRNTDNVGDTTATLVPSVDGLVLFGDRAFLQFKESLEYTSYARYRDQNYVNQRGSGRLTFPFERFGVFTDFALNRVRTRPLDREDARPKRLEDRLGVGLVFEVGWRTEIEFSRSATDWTYTDDDGESAGLEEVVNIGVQLDRAEDRSQLAVRYHLKGRTRLTLELGARDIDFDAPPPLNLKDTRENTAYAEIEFGEGGSLKGTARIGVADLEALDPEQPDLSETVGDLQLQYWLTGNTRLELDGVRLPGFTAVGDDSYYVNTSVSLRGIQYLTRFFGVEAGAGFGTLRFPGASGSSDRRDDLTEFDTGIRLRLAENSLGRQTVYSFKVGRFRRDSTDPGRNRTRTTVTFGAVLGF